MAKREAGSVSKINEGRVAKTWRMCGKESGGSVTERVEGIVAMRVEG